MNRSNQIIYIAIASSIIGALALSLILGVTMLVLSPVVIAIAFPFCTGATFAFDRLFTKHPSFRAFGFLFSIIGGLLIGFIVYVLLFFDNIFTHNAFSSTLALQYSSVGLIMGLSTAGFYFYGPLKIAPNKCKQQDC